MNRVQAIKDAVRNMLSTDFNNSDPAIASLKLYTLDVIREQHLDRLLKRPPTQFKPLKLDITVGGICYSVGVTEEDIVGTPFHVITDFALQVFHLQQLPTQHLVAQRYLLLAYIHLVAQSGGRYIGHHAFASYMLGFSMLAPNVLLDASDYGLVNMSVNKENEIDDLAITELGLSVLSESREQLLAGYNSFPTLEELMSKGGNVMFKVIKTTPDIENLRETKADEYSERIPEKLKPNTYGFQEQVEECNSSTLLHRLADVLINEHNLIGGETAEVVVRGADYTIRVEVEYNQ